MRCTMRCVMHSVRLALLVLVVAVGLSGCRFGQYPDPNKSNEADKYDGERLQNNVRAADENLTRRLLRGEINASGKKTLLQDYIRDQLGDIDLEQVPSEQVWRYADLYRQLEDWKTTDALYSRAVGSAKNEDRRVNDTLRLAEAKARLKDVPKGIELVRSTFTAAPGGKAPILMAALYEFAPAALGQDHDIEVAKLLEDAIEQHMQTVVDPNTDAGRLFIEARPFHVKRAWEIVVRIYRESGDEKAFRAAIERSDAMLRRFAAA